VIGIVEVNISIARIYLSAIFVEDLEGALARGKFVSELRNLLIVTLLVYL
jgi:hypothetical protein